MVSPTKTSSTVPSFAHFLTSTWHLTENRKWGLLAAGASLIQFVTLKYFYPFPDFISDSYSYIYAAEKHLSINIWPIGYSWFLSAVHTLSHSDLTLVSIQYLILEFASLYLFFTLKYLVKLSKLSTLLLFIFLAANPLFIYMSNFVNSDALFASLSFLWLANLMWIIRQPSLRGVILNAALIFLCFTVRNNAYYYPIISLFAFMMTKGQLWFKTLGTILPLMLLVPFILYTRNAAYTVTGTRQYSLFTGWQLANNALYAYDLMSVDSNRLPDQKTRELDRLTRSFYHSVPPHFHQILADYTGNFFIRESKAPLKKYVNSHYETTGEESLIATWGKASADFSVYGNWLIRRNPVAYFRGFVLLNLKTYLYPPLSNFESYNIGLDEAWTVAQDWFDWKAPEIRSASKDAPKYLFYLFPVLFLFLNVYVLGGSILLVFVKRQAKSAQGGKLILLSQLFLIVNFGFSAVATINVLRYQIVPMTVALISTLWLTQLLDIQRRRADTKRFMIPDDLLSTSTTRII